MAMFVKSLSPSIRQFQAVCLLTPELCGVAVKRACSSAFLKYDDRDPASVFFDKTVQTILKRVTGKDLEKVFQRRMIGKLDVPKYQFVTKEELEEKMAHAERKAGYLLHMPPVLKERQPIKEVLSQDPALKGYNEDDCKYVFTDISSGATDRTRTIVVRDPDGTLRKASWEERDRINQVYNPKPRRKITPPKVFHEEYLKDVLSREKYTFVLDYACVQFDPDHPDYQRVTSTTYEAVEDHRHYEMLHSTRHYGPMCFYLAWHRKIDNLLIHLIQKEKLSDCADIVRLYQIIHKDSKSASLNLNRSKHMDLLKAYVEHDSLRRPQLQLAIRAYQDIIQEREDHAEAVKGAHGVEM